MAALDPTQGADASGTPDDSQDSQDQFVVCIAANGDGTYSVYSQDSDDDQDDGGSSGGDDQPQSADSIDEALQIAGQMLQEEESEDSGEDSGGDSGDDGEPMSGDDAQSYWNQLAAKKSASKD